MAVDGGVAVVRRALGGRPRGIPSAPRAGPSRLPHERYLWDSGFHWGEWLVPGEDLKGPDEFEAFRRSDKADVATAYFAYSARLMSRIAEAIGRDGEAARYRELADRVARRLAGRVRRRRRRGCTRTPRPTTSARSRSTSCPPSCAPMRRRASSS